MTVTPKFQSPAQTSAFSSRLTFPCLLGTFALMSDKHPCSFVLAIILISINGNSFLPVTQAKILGVLLSSLSLSPQSDPTSKSYWLSLQNTSKIHHLVPFPLLPLEFKSPSFLIWNTATAPQFCLLLSLLL